ncbi:MAG: exo-alpha-sialidase [Verrucomicrobiales bacterium]|nr:exo-alpha-sialidase [Verrucomicrobiales bacterium]
MNHRTCLKTAASLGLAAGVAAVAADRPFLESELIFPYEVLHNHASCIVETPRGDLLVTWFRGSGERTADDVQIMGARQRAGESAWSPPFVMADAPDFPDGNPCLFVAPDGRLWLFHTTIQANTWESALLKYHVSTDYDGDGCPQWADSRVLHVKPGGKFVETVQRALPQFEALAARSDLPPRTKAEVDAFLGAMRDHADDKLYRRLGWMTRAHPFLLNGSRLIVPLYHDGFSFSLMALTDDWGQTWQFSTPLVGAGNIQPSLVHRRDGSLYTLMRDNGPPPQRLLQSDSRDGGETWSTVTDSDQPNPGSGAEIIGLRNGLWVLINNDTEQGRHSLVVRLSDDEGKTWRWERHLERDAPGPESGRYHYPSIIEAADGTLHASYSYHLHRSQLPKDLDGDPAAKSVKHAHFNLAWVMEGDL